MYTISETVLQDVNKSLLKPHPSFVNKSESRYGIYTRLETILIYKCSNLMYNFGILLFDCPQGSLIALSE